MSDKKTTLLERFARIPEGVQWTIGGMAGGLVMGLVFVVLNGMTMTNVLYWLGFGLIVGGLGGAMGWGITWLTKKIIAAKR